MAGSSIKLIVSDIDGTLLPDGCDAHGRSRDGAGVADGIQELAALIRERNLPFTLESGRPLSMIRPLADVLGVTLPVVASNGAAAADFHAVYWQEFLNTQLLRPAIELADALQLAVIWTDGMDEWVYRENNYTRRHAARNGEWSKCKRPDREADWDAWKLQKLLIIDPASPGKTDEVIRAIEARPDSNAEIIRYDDRGIEVMPKGCTKGTGLRRLAAQLGIPLPQVMAIGDNKNDLHLFAEAGVSAAVANASDVLKEKADYVSRGTSVYGVIEAIRRLAT